MARAYKTVKHDVTYRIATEINGEIIARRGRPAHTAAAARAALTAKRVDSTGRKNPAKMRAYFVARVNPNGTLVKVSN